jgi:hypothetical protein
MINISRNNLLNISFALLFLIIFIPLTVTSQEPLKEKYLITTAGNKIYIKTISSMTGDTLFLITNSGSTFIPIDSVAEYHHTAPGRGGQGCLIGAVSGLAIGVIIGVATAPEVDNSNLTTAINTTVTNEFNPAAGGLVGLVLGGGIGYLIGNALYENTHYDFRTMSIDKKKRILSDLIYK